MKAFSRHSIIFFTDTVHCCFENNNSKNELLLLSSSTVLLQLVSPVVTLTLSLPTNCIADAVSSRDHSPEKAEQTKNNDLLGELCMACKQLN